MNERRALGHLSREPLYNTRAVHQATEVPADTFRAWERRYGLPRPYRTSGNQRLYSERDIGVIGWLRDRTSEGMTISQAISRLRIEHPDVMRTDVITDPDLETTTPASDPQFGLLRERLIAAVADFDELAGERVIDEALALFTLEEACTKVIEPTLIEIGERWSRNELSVTAEHFATRLVTRRLSTIFNLVSPAADRGAVVAACAPTEEHEVGLLILSIFLARRNWRVIYLGANVPLEDLIGTIRQVMPDIVCLSASTEASARRALEVVHEIGTLDAPSPPVAFGGRGFALLNEISIATNAHHLAGGAAQIADQIAEIVTRHQPRRSVGRSLST